MSQKQIKPPVPLKIPPGSPLLQQRSVVQQPLAEPQSITMEMLQQALKKNVDEIKQHMDSKIEDMSQKLEKLDTKFNEHAQVVREDILYAFEGLAGMVLKIDDQICDLQQADLEMEKVTNELKQKIMEVENRTEKTEMDTSIIQFQAMEMALRIRGLPENPDEDLLNIFETVFAQLLDETKEAIGYQIERIYCVNSWIARNRKLPRDIVVYFTTKKLRNEILRISFDKKVEISGHEVIILKEIPPKILRARKDYAFLVEKLKKQQIKFRWEIPVGLSFMFNGKRYRINSIQKAREFYVTLQGSRPPSPQGASAQMTEKDQEVLPQKEAVAPLQSQEGQITQEDLLSLAEKQWDKPVMKDQRMTRAAAKKQEEEMRAQLTRPLYSEAVGGGKAENGN